jgi:hypothetical protein
MSAGTNGLNDTHVSKCLDKKLTMAGFEVADLLIIFMMLAVLNFIFGEGFKLLFVWIPTITLALVLRFGKRGKPDNYLVHLIRYHTRPGVYSAFLEPTIVLPPPRARGRH